MKFNTIKEACQAWVQEFNAIPQSIIEKAYPDLDGEVEILATERICGYCDGTEFTENEEGELVCDSCERTGFERETYDLPMWGTMWTFGSSLDSDWALRNIEAMRECGFWVYQSDELGVFFGINGAGYDFYEAHWVPLYKARGLQWHSETTEG